MSASIRRSHRIAYAKYMKTLYNQFGDWYLAMAAYDWGPGNVQRAVMRTGYADFWELYRRNVLPGETKNYVPGIIAAIIMAKNPKQYGLDKLVPDRAVVSDTVTVDYAIDLRLVADVTNASLPEIVALNPSLLRMTTPRDMSFDLHIPVGMRDVFNEAHQGDPGGQARELALPRGARGRDRSMASRRASCASERDRRGEWHLAWRDASMSAMNWSFPLPQRSASAHPAAVHRASWRYAGHGRRPLQRVGRRAAALESSVVERGQARQLA